MLKIFFRSIAMLTFAASTLIVSPVYAGGSESGASWVAKGVPVATTFLGVDFTADGRKGLAVGTGGVFAMTFDSGKTWAPVSLPPYPNDLQDIVYLPGTTTAVAVGNNGTILKFTLNGDGSGYSLSDLSVGGADIFNSVSFSDTQNGWIVSNGARIYRTANGGQTWSLQNNPSAQPLKRVRATAAGRVWAVGANGTIIFASDGATWVQKTSGTTETLNDIALVGSDLWAVGANRVILKSVDGGTTWAALNSVPASLGSIYLRVRAADANMIYVSGTKGAYLISSDGGANWHDLSNAGQTYFYGLTYIKPTLQAAVGSDSRIMLYDTGKPTAPANVTVSPAGVLIANNTPTLSWGASTDAETNVASYELRINGGAYTDIGNVLNTTVSALPEGTNTLYLRAKDAGGTTSDPVVLNFSVDTTAPVVSGLSPTSVITGTLENYIATATDTNGISDCHLFVNGSDRGGMNYDAVKQQFYLSYTLYTAATYQFTALCTDAAGNKNVGAITNVVAAGAPVAPPAAAPADSGANGAASGANGGSSGGSNAGGSSGSNGSSGNFVTQPNPNNYDPGVLIKLACPNNAGVNDPCRAVYFVGADKKRHAFPNSKVYFTWYVDFDGVVEVSAATMSSFMLGKNIVYRPGIKMVKFMTDPKVYAVSKGGVLRWVPTEAAAKTMYGSVWAKNVDDVNDAFIGDYLYGPDVSVTNGFNPTAESAAVWNVLLN